MIPEYNEIADIKKVISKAKAHKNVDFPFIYKGKQFSVINRNNIVFDIAFESFPSYTICIPIANVNKYSKKKLVKGISVILYKLINYMVYSNIIFEAENFSESKAWKKETEWNE